MTGKLLKYPPEFKKEVCEFALKENIAFSSKYYKVNRKTVAKWTKVYKKCGLSGLYEPRKRNDNQPAKLNRESINKIIEYKETHPEISLRSIREVFSLDCSLPLISVKLKKIYLWKSINKKEQELYITYGIMNRLLPGNTREKTYRFELHDSLHRNIYYGFSQDCSIRNLCVFTKFVITCLENAGRLKKNAKVVTNITYLLRSSVPYSDYDRLIRNEFGIDIFYSDRARKFYNGAKRYHDSLKSVYRASVLNNNEHYIPPFSIESMLRQVNINDTPGRGWLEAVTNHKVANQLMTDAVKQIEYFADQAKIDFNFDKALKFYGKIYQATVSCPKSEIIKINVLFKKAMIYYHLDSYGETKSALLEILELNKKCDKTFNAGQVHYYLGMVFKIENDLKRSGYHLDNAVKLLYEGPRNKNLFNYFQAIINKYMITGNYNSALKWANKYLRSGKHHCLTEQICKAFDLRGIVYFYLGKYYKSAKDFKSQLHLSQKNELLVQEIKAIYNLFSVSPYYYINQMEHINRLNEITRQVKKQLFLHNCNNQLGNYYFRKGQYASALCYFKEEVSFYKKINDRFYYFRNLHYLALCNYYLGDHNTALKSFFEICSDNSMSNFVIISHSYNFIGRIFNERNDFIKSIKFFRKSIKYAVQTNYGQMKADSLMCLGHSYKKQDNKVKSIRYFKKARREFYNIRKYNKSSEITDQINFVEKNIHDLHNLK